MTSSDLMGHELFGAGATRVIVMNDWLCDTSTWDAARPYLDRERFTWAFADLRGYGRSRGRRGAYNVIEGAGDVIELANALGWKRFAIVGHSMSTLVALHLAQHHPDRITRVVVITPAPPTGFGADDAWLEAGRARELDPAARVAALKERFATRLSPGWAAFKIARAVAASDPAASSAYNAMYARDGLPDAVRRIEPPVLAITGEQDFEPMRSASVTRSLSPICAQLSVVPLIDSGHYPMQEMPPLTVATVERFLADPPQ